MEKAKKKCRNCNDPIFYGRSDKVFCEDLCRYEYHNNNGLRIRLFEFYLDHRDLLVNYVDEKIKELTIEKDRISMKLNKAGENSYDNVNDQRCMLKLHKDLSQLRKLKRSIPLKND